MTDPVYVRLIALCETLDEIDSEGSSKTADFRFASEDIYQSHADDIFYGLVDYFNDYLEKHDPGWVVADVIESYGEITGSTAVDPINIDDGC